MQTFPTALFAPSSFAANLVGAAISGGQSLSGITQSAVSDGGGFWAIEFGASDLWPLGPNGEQRRRIWNAFAAMAAQGAVPFIVPICQRLDQPFLAGNVKRGLGIGMGDDSKFSDGAVWAAETITAALTGGAALRATTVRFSLSGATSIIGGEWFTIWGPSRGQRLYNITTASQNEDSSWTCGIMPPLREAAPEGTVLDFDNPRCQMNVVGSVGRIAEQLKFPKSPAVRFAENFLLPGV